jgi:hypothetical protein
LSIPKSDEKFDEFLVIGKKLSRTIELNEIAYTELILSINVNAKTAFNIVRWHKSKDYPDGNLVIVCLDH